VLAKVINTWYWCSQFGILNSFSTFFLRSSFTSTFFRARYKYERCCIDVQFLYSLKYFVHNVFYNKATLHITPLPFPASSCFCTLGIHHDSSATPKYNRCETHGSISHSLTMQYHLPSRSHQNKRDMSLGNIWSSCYYDRL